MKLAFSYKLDYGYIVKTFTFGTLLNTIHSIGNYRKSCVFSAFAIVTIHGWLSYYFSDFTWLASSGAILTIFGLVLILSYSLPITQESMLQYLKFTVPLEHEGMALAELVSDAQKEKNESEREGKGEGILKDIRVYVTLTIFGTLLWAYAGYLNLIFYPVRT